MPKGATIFAVLNLAGDLAARETSAGARQWPHAIKFDRDSMEFPLTGARRDYVYRQWLGHNIVG
jgi:hypothetical protein